MFSMVIFVSSLVIHSPVQAESAAKNKLPSACQRWFSKQKIKGNEDCSLKCSLAESDMGTFDCSRFCDELCESKPDLGFQISHLYPGLTEAERKFVDQNPVTATKAYWLSWRAEGSCKSIYFKSDTNDESDACRHYMWAAFMNQSLGTAVANQILDAHEKNESQPEQERAMDLANNRRGIIISSEMMKAKEVFEKDFLEQFKKDLLEGKLVVLKRRSK
jgi:hypothetical protein